MKTLVALLIGCSLAASAQSWRYRDDARRDRWEDRRERAWEERREARWEVLGDAHVDGMADHDRIVVSGYRGEYRAIAFRVDRAPVVFDRVLVRFGNGTTEEIALRHRRVPEGSQSGIIDLPGYRRVIESVEFWYERADWGFGRRPKVTLFGMR